MELLNIYHRYNDSDINEKCLSIILDNPIKFFDEIDFLEAPVDVMRSVLKPIGINCTSKDLKNALSTWVTNKGLEYETDWYATIESHLNISKTCSENLIIQ
jgi:hypothetical protein